MKIPVGGNILETEEDPGDQKDSCRQMLDDAKKPCQVMPNPGSCKQLHTEKST